MFSWYSYSYFLFLHKYIYVRRYIYVSMGYFSTHVVLSIQQYNRELFYLSSSETPRSINLNLLQLIHLLLVHLGTVIFVSYLHGSQVRHIQCEEGNIKLYTEIKTLAISQNQLSYFIN